MIPRRTLAALADVSFPDPPYTGSEVEQADFRAVFLGTPQGKRVLARLFWACGYFEALSQPVDPSWPDRPMMAVAAEAKRSVAVMVATILDQESKDG